MIHAIIIFQYEMDRKYKHSRIGCPRNGKREDTRTHFCNRLHLIQFLHDIKMPNFRRWCCI